MAHRDEYTYEEEQQILLDLEEKAYEEQLLTAQEMDLELECEYHRVDKRGIKNEIDN